MEQLTEKQLTGAFKKNRRQVETVKSGVDVLIRDREDLVLAARGIVPFTVIAELLGVDRRTVYDYLARAKGRQQRETVQ